jgi:hypothetical protein
MVDSFTSWTRREERTGCKVRHSRSICQLLFPALEAQLGGRWTVIVVKRSDPPASVSVHVTFNTP